MAASFAERFAPHLALPPYDDGSGGGMSGPDQGRPQYDRSGAPLPYFDSGIGPRQYFGERAPPPNQPEANAPIDNSGTAVPYTQNQGGPRQYSGTPGPGGLIGRTPGTPGVPMVRGRAGLEPDVPPTQDMLSEPVVRPGDPGAPASIAPVSAWDPRVLEDRIMEGIRTGHINPVTPDATGIGGDVYRQQGRTLEDLLSHFNFQFPNMPSMLGGRQNTPRTKTVPSSSATSPTPNTSFIGRAAEIEALLIQRGLRLTHGAGVRNTNAVRGGHPEGNSIDVPPDELETAVRIIRADPRFRDLPMQPIYIRRGQRFPGGVVATGNHYHIDLGPAAQR